MLSSLSFYAIFFVLLFDYYIILFDNGKWITSNCRKVPSNIICLRWRVLSWFCISESSKNIIDSQSLMTVSPMPSCNNRDLSISVEMTTSSEGWKSLLDSTLGKRSLAASNASIHAVLSSLDKQHKWRVFVPVNMVSLLSSDLLARIEETCALVSKLFSHLSPKIE